MAYVPPHKRLSNTLEGSNPTPEPLITRINKNLNLRSDKRMQKHGPSMKKILYAENAISKWLAVPVQDDGQIPASVRLVPVSMESVERKSGEKPLTLLDDPSLRESSDVENCHLKTPWTLVVENVQSDLVSTFQNVRNQIEDPSSDVTKPTIVARFGKLLFHSNTSRSGESLKGRSVSEASLRNLKRFFYTSVPASYIEHVNHEVVPKIGLQLEGVKEQYHVKLADARQPDSTISCKCRVLTGEKKLELYKMELNQVRDLIADVSCMDSSVDLRLALCSKRAISVLTDDDKEIICDLINSAILDPNTKGGLRWPLGKANSGGRYSIVGVWHIKSEFHSDSSLRLKVKEADRYDFLSSTGEVTREVSLKLTGMMKALLEQRNDALGISCVLQDSLKLIWEHFLRWDGCIV